MSEASEHTSDSGTYWKEHVLSWEAGAYYKDRHTRPSFWDRTSSIFRGRAMYVRMEAASQLVSAHVEGLRVLDIGCGSGRFAFELLEAGAQRVIGVDVSPAAIEAANARRGQSSSVDRLDFRVMDLTDPDVRLPQVDLITALGVIEYFDAPALSALLGKFDTRYFLIDFPDADGRKRNRLSWYLRQVYLHVNKCPGVHLYTQDEFRRMAAEHGIEAVRYAHRSSFDYVTNLPQS
ncbi:MAG TPA: methyltransferase domain-containing protein [Gaiellaceae bacterium]